MSCREVFGLPCSTNLPGTAFLAAAYGIIIYKASATIGSGAAALLPSGKPVRGIASASVWCIPSFVVLLAGTCVSSPHDLEDQLGAQLGLASGCLVLLLSVGWAGCIHHGSSADAAESGGAQPDPEYDGGCAVTISSPGSSASMGWSRAGICSSAATQELAQLLLLSCLPYCLPLLSSALSIRGPSTAIAGIALCCLGLLGLVATQAVMPEWRRRLRVEQGRRRQRHLAVRALTWFSSRFGSIVDSEGRVNVDVAELVFAKLDRDADGLLSRAEVQGMLATLELLQDQYDDEQLAAQVAFWLQEMEGGAGAPGISKRAFVAGLDCWIQDIRRHFQPSSPKERKAARKNPRLLLIALPPGGVEPQLALQEPLLDEERGTEPGAGSDGLDCASSAQLLSPQHSPSSLTSSRGASRTSSLLLGLSPLLASRIARLSAALLACSFFAAPFFSSLTDLAAALCVPAFYATFTLAPLAMVLRPCQLAWQRAGRKRHRHVASAVVQLLQMAGCFNTAGMLVVFCSAVAHRHAVAGAAESLVTLVPAAVVCTVAATRQVVHRYWAPAAAGLYALSLLLALLVQAGLRMS